MVPKQLLTTIAGFLGLYLFSAGVSFAVFTYLLEPPTFPGLLTPSVEEGPVVSETEGGLKALLDTSGPKNQTCPINGEQFTKNEKEAWEKRRPLLVMIENHQESRPQSGLSFADVVYEAVAEGGITRFMGVYYCGAQAYEVILGPVRSARTYFLDWASEYGGYPLYTHVGGANTPGPANALGQIEDYGWGGAIGNDLNQFSIGYPTFWRDYERLGRTVATEHTMYSTTERLWKVAKDREWTDKSPEGEAWDEDYVSWKLGKKEPGETDRGNVAEIRYSFWKNYSDYDVRWAYDKVANLYRRFNDGEALKDLDTDKQLEVKNVIVLSQTESRADDGYEGNVHLLYDTTGEGKAWVFMNGQVTEGKWVKKTRLDRTRFYDKAGKEVEFTPGKIWVSIVPLGVEPKY
jgi:hypothetical protein